MLLSNDESEKLFSKCVTVSLKDTCTNHCRLNKLIVTVEWQTPSVTVNKQELSVTLTDDNDPFFLYTLNLCEDDFQMLKVAQGLLVDFSAFPQKFIDLLQLCIQEEHKTQPKFLLVLNLEDRIGSVSRTSQLDIIETNPFKHLTHLSLKLVAATDVSAKQYLASCFKKLKEDKLHLQKRLEYVEKDLHNQLLACQESLSSKVQELEVVRKELSVELSVKESSHARNLQEERERLLNKHREEEEKYEVERREKELNLRKQIQQLEARISCLDTLNKEIQDKNYNCDRTIRTLESQNRALEGELQKAKDRHHSLAQQIDNLHSEIKEKKSQISSHKESILQLEHRLCEKKELVQRLQQNIDISCEQRKSLEDELEEKRRRIEIFEKSEKAMTEHISKSNVIIDKLMLETRTCDDKLKKRYKVNLKMEETMQEKDKMIKIINKELSEAQNRLATKDSEIKKLSGIVSSLREKIVYLEGELNAKGNVVKFLNRQLVDKGIIPQYTPPEELSNLLQLTKEMENYNWKTTTPSVSSTKSSPILPSMIPRLQTPMSEPQATEQQRIVSTPKLPTPTSATVTTDSAYSTLPTAYTSHTAKNSATNDEFSDIDSALSAAFGSGDYDSPLHRPETNAPKKQFGSSGDRGKSKRKGKS